MRRTKSTEEKAYVLGTGQSELERLGFQHQLWSALAANGWERAGFGWANTILDVGSGPGYATFDLARLVGHHGKIIAADVSSRFLEHLKTQSAAQNVSNIETHLTDVQKLALPANSIDGAFARWVFCFVPRSQSVIAGVARALRSGGRFVIHDYFHYEGIRILPHHPIFDRIFHAIAESWRVHGGDPDIGGRLPTLLAKGGFHVRQITPMLRIARPGDALWYWPDTFFRNYLPTLVEMKLINGNDLKLFNREWNLRGNDPNAFFSSPPMVEIIAEKKFDK